MLGCLQPCLGPGCRLDECCVSAFWQLHSGSRCGFSARRPSSAVQAVVKFRPEITISRADRGALLSLQLQCASSNVVHSLALVTCVSQRRNTLVPSQLRHLLITVRLHYKKLCTEAALAAMHCAVWHHRLQRLSKPGCMTHPPCTPRAGCAWWAVLYLALASSWSAGDSPAQRAPRCTK